VIQSRAQDTNHGVKQLRITWKVLETLETNQFLPLMAIRRRTGSDLSMINIGSQKGHASPRTAEQTVVILRFRKEFC